MYKLLYLPTGEDVVVPISEYTVPFIEPGLKACKSPTGLSAPNVNYIRVSRHFDIAYFKSKLQLDDWLNELLGRDSCLDLNLKRFHFEIIKVKNHV